MPYFTKTGITLIGSPGSGKTGFGEAIHPAFPELNWHDFDNDGLEHPEYGWGAGGVAKKVKEVGDRTFLLLEGKFAIEKYGLKHERKPFVLDSMLLSLSGSLPLSRDAMGYIRQRTHVIYLAMPTDVAIEKIRKREDGDSRIVGMNGGPNGEKPMRGSLEEELRFRRKIYEEFHDYTVPYHENKRTRAAHLTRIITEILLSRTIPTPSR